MAHVALLHATSTLFHTVFPYCVPLCMCRCVLGIWLAGSMQAVVHQFGRTVTPIQQMIGACTHRITCTCAAMYVSRHAHAQDVCPPSTCADEPHLDHACVYVACRVLVPAVSWPSSTGATQSYAQIQNLQDAVVVLAHTHCVLACAILHL